MQSSAERLLLIIIATSFIFFSGCYTLLKHPSPEGPRTDDYSSCGQCHNNYYMATSYNPYYRGPWWDYYSVPWWYNDLLVVTDDGDEIPMRTILGQRYARRSNPLPSPSMVRTIVAPGANKSGDSPVITPRRDISNSDRKDQGKTRDIIPSRQRVIRKRDSSDRKSSRRDTRSPVRKRKTRKSNDSGDRSSSRSSNSGDRSRNTSREKREK